MITLIKNISVVNEGSIQLKNVYIKDDKISDELPEPDQIIDGSGKYLLPGVIDDQVHFREPGLTSKADIYTESRAAAAGGITSFMEMPNTIPQTTTIELLEEKNKIASQNSLTNYSFYLGATNDNFQEITKLNPEKTCGVKVFLGSSTGNMLVDDPEVLKKIFLNTDMLIAAHCEDENTVKQNMQKYRLQYGEDVPIHCHPLIRSEEACFKSSSFAVSLAKQQGTRLHVIHVSTAKELTLFDNSMPFCDKKITSEVCIHHLWFSHEDYADKGALIKWNPAVKTKHDRDSLFQGLLDNKLDVIATDHSPHLLKEKQNTYFKAPSGGPLVQHALPAMLEHYHNKKINLETIVEKMCHAPAILFKIKGRGFIREGYYADLVIVDLHAPWKVSKENIYYKCGWSPFEGYTFQSRILTTFVNGHIVFEKGKFNETRRGSRLRF